MEELKFDKEIHSKFKDIAIIDYGIVEGNNIIVFIKAGQDGSLYEYQNKYIKMAKRLYSILYRAQLDYLMKKQ